MSDTIRIALVAEGITDYDVLNAAIESMLGGRSFDLKLLQPEGSVAFIGSGEAGEFGGGWKGVYRWCHQAVARSEGQLRDDPLFLGYDLLLIHLDADVAGEDPADSLPELAALLPCAQPCPPSNATTDALRKVLLGWVGETQVPPRTVLCTPSKSTEAWDMGVFFPSDKEMLKHGFECYAKPENRLGQQPLRQRFAKTHSDYAARALAIQAGWPSVVDRLTEAHRFQADFMAAVSLAESWGSGM
ncbi:hypothetical protein [uncultured Thiodictyon sp.]|uniref:hypothetical protein n=1 Tax=uncultured Thiodictyon sp. TaxID=1846217 RepID=UPI0025FCC91C|nr:hypothetical protein [uncultured Thiodictyon sp.]